MTTANYWPPRSDPRGPFCCPSGRAIDARDLTALKGLERIYARKESFDGLLEVLSAQVDLAPTPKQRIALLERVGLLYEEEFVDHGQAAKCFEDIISIDATHEVANLALARLYLQEFDEMWIASVPKY